MLVRGEVVMSADAKEVLAKPDMREIFLGATAPNEVTADRAP
jgi:ABC-type branched-subunit amino acid transport system ATPase component